MIIAVTAKEGSLQSEVDPHFGRAAYFMIANSQTGEVFAHDNSEGVNAGNGAGTSAAQLMAENKVDILFTGSVGPKASEVLEKVGIKVQENTTGTVEVVLDKFASDITAQTEVGGQEETIDPPKNDAIRLAIPADSGDGLKAPRSGHFGKCAYYILVDIKDNEIQEVLPLKNGGHVTGGCFAPVMLLQGNHVSKLIVGGIGGRPLQGFKQVGIDVLFGGGQSVEESVNLFLTNQIEEISNDQVCGGGA
jgi:predicted Fe-Mo cluster-binding NifX family protein